MPVKLKMGNNELLIKFAYSILIISYYLSLIINNTVINNLKYLLLVVFIIYLLILRKELFQHGYRKERFTNLNIIIYFLSVNFIALPFINFVISHNTQILLNMILAGIYLSFLWLSAKVVHQKNLLPAIAKIFFAVSLMTIIYVYIQNPNNLLSFSVIQSAFNADARIRGVYEGIHPNTVANICFIFFISGFYLNSIVKQVRKYRIIFFLANIFVLLVLLNTGSRAAIISLVIFLTTFYVDKYISFRVAFSVVPFATAIMIIFFGVNSQNVSGDILNKISSNRIDNWIYTFNYMLKGSNSLMGLGYLNPKYFYSDPRYYFLSTDNWFLYTFVTLGIMGILLSAFLIGYLVKGISNEREKSDDKRYIISLVTATLIYSMFEIIFFIPSGITSMLFWIFVLARIEQNRNKSFLSIKGLGEIKL